MAQQARRTSTARNQRRYSRREEKESIFDLLNIIKYLGLWILFALISFGVKTVVLKAVNMSPTRQCGNGVLSLYEVHNPGAAFNLFSNQPEMIIMASFLAVAILTAIVLLRSGRLAHSAISAMALLSSGITMNMLERIQYGYVIDYVHCDFLNNFPVFNTSDIFIVAGAIGLVLAILFGRN